jgi:hypothetical protein
MLSIKEEIYFTIFQLSGMTKVSEQDSAVKLIT